ncbi:MAG: hypothetical protein OJF47_001971 [Nitrospira sp.]|jgi:hypothetical protein|nr:MAG: hypothetical protein OJF47_001971 [Nitrospira sp.]
MSEFGNHAYLLCWFGLTNGLTSPYRQWPSDSYL